MKKTLVNILLIIFISSISIAQTVEGTWKLAPEAGALGVGPGSGDYGWWSNGEADVTTRACLFDDLYVFNADGSFQNIVGESTWLEPWQGVDPEGCGVPIAPHNGSNAATWTKDVSAGTITILGEGAFVGLAKVTNTAEDGKPVDNTITYSYKLSADGNRMDVTINGFQGAGSTAEWIFKLVKVVTTPLEGSWSLAPEAGALWVGDGATTWWSSSLEDVTTRASLFDDKYIFNGDGTFKNVLGTETWLETWQTGVTTEGAGAPVAPHDGSNPAIFRDTTYLGVNYFAVQGLGAYVGLSKVHNTGEDGTPIVLSELFPYESALKGLENVILYSYVMDSDGLGMTVSIGGFNASVTAAWVFKFVKNTDVDRASPLSGATFQLAPVAGALGVGPGPGDYGWWSSSIDDVTARACIFDDEYVFNADGSFQNVQGDQTWLEGWQEGQEGESCGTPIAPHNGSNAATWVDNGDGTVTITGLGAYLGLAKVNNTNELGTPVGNAITYKYVMDADENKLDITIQGFQGAGTTSEWIFRMAKKGYDLIPPVAATDIGVISGAYSNGVSWVDVPDEAGATYTVYASRDAITAENLSSADVVATGIVEGSQEVSHALTMPLSDRSVPYYYAVVCTDANGNVGPLTATSSATTNTARGIPTISLTPPAAFAADGDMSEWETSGIIPIEFGVSTNSMGNPKVIGTVTDDTDASMKLYMAVDDTNLYVAADITDDVFNVGDGNWWEQDAFELFLGLYDQRGARHGKFSRGAEPDYKFVIIGDSAFVEFGQTTPLNNKSYFHLYNSGVNGSTDAVIEFKINLDSLAAINGDSVFSAEEGMRVIFEPTWHDNDGSYEGNIVLSSLNNDNAWQTTNVWSHTYIGRYDGNILSADEDIVATRFELKANYPNPFNPTTTIEYSIGMAGQTRLMVYDIMGREIAMLVNEYRPMGTHKIVWNASSMPSGIYFYRLETSSFTRTQKMVLMK
jgi:hypothetical protein|tara:strand:- start:150 stop:3056 length:2907 start_codon:yes stop_codon:yes gene_type:complete